MSRRPLRLSRLFTVLVAAATVIGVNTASAAGAGSTPSSASQADHAPSREACFNRVNDTARKLLPCIQTADLKHQMRILQDIADDNPGPDGHPSRNGGEPGYKASADFVARVMRQAGYSVHIQTYKFFYFAYTALPALSQVSPTARNLTLSTDFTPAESSGTANASIQPAGGIILPPTPKSSSSSGCTAADFAGFVPGHIALIQRGTCQFGVKVQNAQAAGASAVLIFNEGNPGRTGLFDSPLVDSDGKQFVPNIPVDYLTFASGTDLLNQYNQAVAAKTMPPVVNVTIKAVVNPSADDYNVIADSRGGDPNHTVVVDAHLDAIGGAGMLDNGSGSITVLNIAQLMRKVNPRNHLRFIWFGGEELGLLGSRAYVNSLSPTDLSKIGYDLDADVTATPNYVLGVLDPAGVNFFTRTVTTQFPPQVYQPSQVARDQGIDYLDSLGFNHELFSPDGTDASTFNQAGIPASGVLTGQDCCKNQQDVSLFGGELGNFEGNLNSTDGGCVDQQFRWCDNLSNNDFRVMTLVSRDFANMVVNMAFNTSVLGGGQPSTHTKAMTGAPPGTTGRSSDTTS